MEGTLENYGNELLNIIDSCKSKRLMIQYEIVQEEDEKKNIEIDLEILTKRLKDLNESIKKKKETQADYENAIAEAERSYSKILESAQILVHSLKRENSLLNKKASLNLQRGSEGQHQDNDLIVGN